MTKTGIRVPYFEFVFKRDPPYPKTSLICGLRTPNDTMAP